MRKPKEKADAEATHVRLAAAIRRMITDGELLPGQLLPPTKELARRLGTYGLAVHKAMGLLAEEGVVERTPHVGTVVTGAATALRTAAVYLPAMVLSNNWNANYYRSVYETLHTRARHNGIRLEVFVDSSKAEDCEQLPIELTRAARAHRFQAIFSLASDKRVAWLSELGLPLASVGGDANGVVGFDIREMVAASVAELSAGGCRSLGVITTLLQQRENRLFFDTLATECERRNVTLRDEWIRSPAQYVDDDGASLFSYRELLAMWRMRKRPAGIFAYPDIVVPGAVSAALKLGLDSRRRASFLFHKNKGNAPFCPFEASWIVSDPLAVAETMFDLVRRQVAGIQVAKVMLSTCIEKAETSKSAVA